MIGQPNEKSSFLNPITKFIFSKLPFGTHENYSEEVAAEENAFVQNVDATLTYSIAIFLSIYTSILARQVNAALTVSSLAVWGLSGLVGKNDGSENDISNDGRIQPGLLRGRYGRQLTLELKVVSLTIGYLLDHNKMYLPTLWTSMIVVDNYVDKVFELGTRMFQELIVN